MNASQALQLLAQVTAPQWGMVTTAQAKTLGVSRLMLSRLSEAGHLTRVAHGVYLDAGASSEEYEDLRAAWLSAEPEVWAEDRLGDLTQGVVVTLQKTHAGQVSIARPPGSNA